eukprot:4212408-Pyramimonas_sp.AAC.1
MGEISGWRLVCEWIARKSQAGTPSLWGVLRVVIWRALPVSRPPARISWDARRAFPLGRAPHKEEEEEEDEEEEEEKEA